jgi:hypothetical protein
MKNIYVEIECHPNVIICGYYVPTDISPYSGRVTDGYVDVDSLKLEGDPTQIQEFKNSCDWDNPSFQKRADCRSEWAQELAETYRALEEIEEDLGDFESDI